MTEGNSTVSVMVTQEEYMPFVSSVAEFTVTVMELFSKYKSMSIALNSELEQHLYLIDTQQDIIKEQASMLEGHRALLLEHEQRLNRIENRLDAGQTHNNEKLSKSKH